MLSTQQTPQTQDRQVHQQLAEFYQNELMSQTTEDKVTNDQTAQQMDEQQLQKSCEVFLDMLSQFDESQIALSFNGGKDCTVALHLLRAVCAILDSKPQSDGTPDNRGRFQKIKFVHFVKNGEFDEIEQFRESIEKMYGIKVELYSADFKGEVKRLIDEQGVKAIIMGNRRTDPYSQNLDHICPSSEGWPEFVRVFPILHWSYQEVWTFLRSNNLCYCELYDQGYTSLGEKHNSQKNPYLLIKAEESVDGAQATAEMAEERYKPAYMLEKEDYERYSRRDVNKQK